MATLRLFVVPHTHFDAEVFITRDETLKWASDNLLDVLYLLDREPSYRFTLDQRSYVEGFATLYPEQMPRLKEHILSGRLQVAGAMHAMPDANLPSGESFVRQILYGRAYESALGTHDTTGWMIDSFGHHPQVPQLMRKAGFDSYVFQRGVSRHEQAAFWWVGLDGSRLRAEWLPYTYAVLGSVPSNLPAFRQVIAHLVEAVAPYIYNDQYLALGGLDLNAPDHHLPEMIRRYNEAQDQVELVLATAREYFAAQPADQLDEFAGDLNPIFTGCYAARIALKQHNRAMEGALFSAEKLLAINWADQHRPVDTLEDAWEPVLFNQFHDLICGSHLDAVYERAMDRYKAASRRVGHATERELDALTSQIDTRGEGIPLVVMNLLGHARTDIARCTVGLGHERWEALALFDADGNEVALQVEDVHRHPDGSVKRADLLFIADVPPLGYRTYFLRPGQGSSPKTDLWVDPVGRQVVGGSFLGDHHPDDGRMGNGLVEVHASLRTGVIKTLLLRDLNWNVVAEHEHGFGSVCRQEDRGDPWEYYGPLRGAVTSTLPLVDAVPSHGHAAFSYDYGGQGQASGGPVMTELRMRSPFGEGKYGIHIRIYAGLPRVEIETKLVNQQPFVRYRNVFPLNLASPRISYEIPFGAIERPEGEYPAQNWVDVSDGERGVALLNRGIPGHSLVGSVLTASLMKCIQVVSYHGGGYRKDARDEGGFELGVAHRFEQALLPHRGTWQAARLPQEGLSFNVPLIVRKVAPHAGPLPVSGSFVTIEPDNVLLHAMYVEENQIVLRVAEAEGRGADGKITLRWPIAEARETDLIGGAARPLRSSRDTFSFSAAPFEIKTFRISLQ